MIALVTGPPGSGKSYYCIRKLADSLEAGKVVATNVDMTDGWPLALAKSNPFRRLIPRRARKTAARWERQVHFSHDLEELFRIRLKGRGEGRGVLVLDEAHRWLNSRLWDTDASGTASKAEATRRRLDIVRFFTLHRKLGWDVYLVTQDEGNIDRQVRNLFEYHVQLRNLRKMKVAGVPVSPVNLFLAVWVWHSAGKAVVKREMYRLNGTRKLYDTFGSSGGLTDAPPDAIWLPRSA